MFEILKNMLRSDESYHYDFANAKRVCRILVIDDDPQALPMQELRRSGYNIEQVEAVDVDVMRMCEDGTYDVILLDYTGVAPRNITPDDGFGVFDRIRAANATQYIIAISAKTYDIAKTEYFKNANDWLKKPTDLVTTKNMIDKAINHCFDREIIFREIEKTLRENGVAKKQIDRTIKALKKNQSTDADKLLELVTNTSRLAALPLDVIGLIKKFMKAQFAE